jgi:vancomycin resistance protein VanJ
VVLISTSGERWWPATSLLYLPRLPFCLPLPVLLVMLAVLRQSRLLVLQAVSACLLAFPLMGFVLPWSVPRTQGGPRVRILSYNLDSIRAGEDGIAATIARYSPDVVALQEIGTQGETLGLRLRGSYPVVLVSGQFLLASRYPITSIRSPDKVVLDGFTHSPRFMSYLVETPLGRVSLYNIHPISPREPFIVLRGAGVRRELFSGRLLSGKTAIPLLDNVRLRALQIETIAALAARESDPVVIAGDTNLPGLSPSLRQLDAYKDGFTAAGWGLGYTFPTYHRPWMRIDRVLAGPSLRFTGFQVGDSRASDHRCVVADLERAPP